MAINRGSKKPEVAVPAELAEMAESAFTAQQMSALFNDVFKEDKKNILEYLEHSTEIQIDDTNKSIKIPDCGSISVALRKNADVDKEALTGLVESGVINIHTLIQMASFTAEKLRTVLGTRADEVLVEKEPTQYLTFKASSDFKASVEEKFYEGVKTPASTSKPKKKSAPKKPTTKKKTARKVTTEAEAMAAIKAASKAVSGQDDLDAILSE